MLKYRMTGGRHGQDREKVVFGPLSELRERAVWVSTKNSWKTPENIEHVSKPFLVGGVKYAYGYFSPRNYANDLVEYCGPSGRKEWVHPSVAAAREQQARDAAANAARAAEERSDAVRHPRTLRQW